MNVYIYIYDRKYFFPYSRLLLVELDLVSDKNS